jgi:hypothetical protein
MPDRLLSAAGATLVASDFTQLNFGTSTVEDDPSGGLTLRMQSRGAPNGIVLYRTAPSTPYVVTAHVLTGPGAATASDNANAIGFRESSSGKLSFISYHYSHSAFVQYLDSPTATGLANSASTHVPDRYDYFLRVENDGANLTYSLSGDGVHFFELRTEAIDYHFDTGPDGIAWITDCQGTSGETMHLLGWSEE